jgi:type II secretory pathway pseudopilin PulG
MIKKSQSGSGLVEVVVASAIMSLVAVAFLGAFAALSRFHERDMLAIKGQLLAEEGLEALRFMKGSGWSALSALPVGQERYFALATSSWSATTSPETVDGVFQRSFVLEAVSRDASDSIVSSGGMVDPNILKARVSVSWLWRNATSTASYETYVTNL